MRVSLDTLAMLGGASPTEPWAVWVKQVLRFGILLVAWGWKCQRVHLLRQCPLVILYPDIFRFPCRNFEFEYSWSWKRHGVLQDSFHHPDGPSVTSSAAILPQVLPEAV